MTTTTAGYYVMYDEHGEALWRSDTVTLEVTVDGGVLTVDTDPRVATPGPLPASLTWLVKDRERLLEENRRLEGELDAARETITMARSALR